MAKSKKKKSKSIRGFLKREFHLPLPKNRFGSFLSRKVRPPKFIRKIGSYFKNSWRELKKVDWPKRKEAWKLTFAVIMFTVVFSVLLTLLDAGFELIAERIFL